MCVPGEAEGEGAGLRAREARITTPSVWRVCMACLPMACLFAQVCICEPLCRSRARAYVRVCGVFVCVRFEWRVRCVSVCVSEGAAWLPLDWLTHVESRAV